MLVFCPRYKFTFIDVDEQDPAEAQHVSSSAAGALNSFLHLELSLSRVRAAALRLLAGIPQWTWAWTHTKRTGRGRGMTGGSWANEGSLEFQSAEEKAMRGYVDMLKQKQGDAGFARALHQKACGQAPWQACLPSAQRSRQTALSAVSSMRAQHPPRPPRVKATRCNVSVARIAASCLNLNLRWPNLEGDWSPGQSTNTDDSPATFMEGKVSL